jgi:hypothetical protein
MGISPYDLDTKPTVYIVERSPHMYPHSYDEAWRDPAACDSCCGVSRCPGQSNLASQQGRRIGNWQPFRLPLGRFLSHVLISCVSGPEGPRASHVARGPSCVRPILVPTGMNVNRGFAVAAPLMLPGHPRKIGFMVQYTPEPAASEHRCQCCGELAESRFCEDCGRHRVRPLDYWWTSSTATSGGTDLAPARRGRTTNSPRPPKWMGAFRR